MSAKFKKNSIYILSLLTLAIAVNSFAASVSFKDLKGVNAEEKITYLQEKGYVAGIGERLFAPYKTVTAAEGIAFIVKALDLNLDTVRFIKEPKATDYYTNADNEAWYGEALIISAVNGLEFPKDIDLKAELSREEFTYYLVSAMEKHGNLPMINIMPAPIADEEEMNILYSGAIQRALVYGITQLDKGRGFNPKAKISRGEAAEQIYNALEYMKAHPAPPIAE